jgi:hypothetical protein
MSEDDASRLAEALREGFARLAAAQLEPAERGRWQQRLIAITNAAKRDLPRALAQLERFERDWRNAQDAPSP